MSPLHHVEQFQPNPPVAVPAWVAIDQNAFHVGRKATRVRRAGRRLAASRRRRHPFPTDFSFGHGKSTTG